MSINKLPPQFEALESLVDEWSLRDEADRTSKRISSSIEQLQGFYDAVMPRLEEMLEYLSHYTLSDMPPEVAHLFYLTLMMSEASIAVELFKQPTVPDTFGYDRFRTNHGSLKGIFDR